MTQWLDISSYPYDDTLGLFRGYTHYCNNSIIRDIDGDELPPVFAGLLSRDPIFEENGMITYLYGPEVTATHTAIWIYGHCPDEFYDYTPLNPTQWMPLSCLDDVV